MTKSASKPLPADTTMLRSGLDQQLVHRVLHGLVPSCVVCCRQADVDHRRLAAGGLRMAKDVAETVEYVVRELAGDDIEQHGRHLDEDHFGFRRDPGRAMAARPLPAAMPMTRAPCEARLAGAAHRVLEVIVDRVFFDPALGRDVRLDRVTGALIAFSISAAVISRP
jgi:hypothetical protein